MTVETVASLGRLAGLRVEPERLAGLRDELVALRRALAEIDDAARSAAAPGIVPFDATWREEVR